MLIKFKNFFLKPVSAGTAIALTLLIVGCSGSSSQLQPPRSSSPEPTQTASATVPPSDKSSEPPQVNAMTAVVTAVETNADTSGAYTFAVTIQSPDTGCDQYADWWEVLSEAGELIYRRILAHSHVNEQPFRRTGGPVTIEPDQPVIVRAHMHPQGYGTQAMQGTVDSGFTETTLPAEFAEDLAQVAPLPSGCTF